MDVLPCEEDARTLSEEMDRPSLIPLVVTENECKDPASFYLKIREKYDSSFLLESLTESAEDSRYSVVGCLSLLHLKMKEDSACIDGLSSLVGEARDRLESSSDTVDDLEVLKKAMFFDEMHFLGLDVPRYVLGVTGYVSYDYVSSLFGINLNNPDDLDHPRIEFVLPALVIVFDHLEEKTYYSSLILLSQNDDFDEIYSEAKSRLEEIISSTSEMNIEFGASGVCRSSNLEKDYYEKGVEKIKEYVREGDVIQTVLSKRIDLEPVPSLNGFYQKLREINPSPYMYFLDFPGQTVVGSSPESLVRVSDDEVMTRPIAGTRSRGENLESDTAMEEELLSDEKERAEHVMLVDLGRNDIGKISKYGSVKLPEFMDIEKYGDVQHIVSTVTGEIDSEKDAFDAFRAIFPAGTVTGAPKVRAMEIIEELEPTRRGIYSGAVGSFSYTGDADFAIAIRTLTSDGKNAQVQVGAGIVSGSVPENEYYETEDKARSLLRAAGVSK